MRRFVLPAVAGFLLLVPATTQAATVTVGSDLSARAALSESHPRDWASWPTTFAGSGGPVASPVEGEVTKVQFKGTVLRPGTAPYPPFDFMVSVLRPQADGTNRVIQTTEGQEIPFNGDDQQITTYDFAARNYNLCVEPGDVVALITSGGFGPTPAYDDGYKVQMFSSVNSSALIEAPASQPDGFLGQSNIGAAGSRTGELLMRSTIGTGDDASFTCRSTSQNQNPTVEFAEPSTELQSTGGTVPFGLRCASVRACEGTLYIKLPTGVIGSGKFNLGGGAGGTVNVTLSDNGKRKLSEAKGRLPVSVLAKVSGGAAVEKDGYVIVGGGGSGGSSVATPVKPKAAVPVRGGKVTLSVRCEGSAACSGKLALAKTGTFFGSAAFSVPAGSARAVAVALNSAGKKALRKATGAAISAKATAKTASGDESVIFKIKRA
jgi:hypothetical protein